MSVVVKRRPEFKVVMPSEKEVAQREYKRIVQNYLRLSGYGVLESLKFYREQDGDRFTISKVRQIIGNYYPKSSWVDKSDERECVLTFLQYAGIAYVVEDENICFV